MLIAFRTHRILLASSMRYLPQIWAIHIAQVALIVKLQISAERIIIQVVKKVTQNLLENKGIYQIGI